MCGRGLTAAPRHPRVAALELIRLSDENRRKTDQLAKNSERDLAASEREARRLQNERPKTEKAIYLSDDVGCGRLGMIRGRCDGSFFAKPWPRHQLG